MKFEKYNDSFGGIDIPQSVYDRAHKQETIAFGAIVYENKEIFRYIVKAPRQIKTGMEKFTCIATLFDERFVIDGYGTASGCGYDKVTHSILGACKSLFIDVEWRSWNILPDIAKALNLVLDKCCFVHF